MRDRTRYPSGRVESRTYVDAGETVTFQGGDAPLELQRAVGVQDWAYDNLHDIVYLADIDPRAVVTDMDYDVEIAGSGIVEPQVFKEAIRVPGEYEVTFPDMDEHVVMTRGEEFTFLWSNHSFDPFDFAFVSFSDTSRWRMHQKTCRPVTNCEKIDHSVPHR